LACYLWYNTHRQLTEALKRRYDVYYHLQIFPATERAIAAPPAISWLLGDPLTIKTQPNAPTAINAFYRRTINIMRTNGDTDNNKPHEGSTINNKNANQRTDCNKHAFIAAPTTIFTPIGPPITIKLLGV
jgi:hypothetical protein